MKDFEHDPLPEPSELTRKRQQEFFQTVPSLPSEAKDYISDLSSKLLEADLRRQVTSDPLQQQQIADNLTQLGLDPNQLQIVLNYFNFSPKENK